MAIRIVKTGSEKTSEAPAKKPAAIDETKPKPAPGKKPKRKKKARKAVTKKPAAAAVKPAPTPPRPEPAIAAPPRDAKSEAEPKKKGGAAPKFTKADIPRVLQVMKLVGNLKAHAAERLGCHRDTITAFIQRYPEEFTPGLEDIQETIFDLVEGEIMKKVRAGDSRMLIWYADRKMQSRGFGAPTKMEVTGTDGGPLLLEYKPDLSACSEEELKILRKAAEEREKK